ncbi:MAG TPA: hypothetical protein VF574_11050 [Allosphingosinicella sp.]|jgi:hypothetical protein
MSFKLIFASAAALAMVAGTPAFAAKSQNQNQQVVASESGGGSAKEKDERKICRFIDKTESRMGRERLCYTKAEWRKFEEAE